MVAEIVVLGVLAVACGGSGPPSDESKGGGGEPATADSPWDQVLAAAAEGQPPPEELVLGLWASLVAPVPGVDPSSWPEDALVPPSGTPLIRWMGEYYDSLTATQQTAIDDVFGGDFSLGGDSSSGDSSNGIISGALTLRGTTASSVQDPQQSPEPCSTHPELTAAARDIAETVGRRFGHAMSRPIVVSPRILSAETAERVWDDLGLLGMALAARCVDPAADPLLGGWVGQGSGTLDTCHIFLFESARQSPALETATLIHEVVHCLQMDACETVHLPDGLDWASEGMAKWVEMVLRPDLGTDRDPALSRQLDGWWAKYFVEPGSLFERSYDAVGFWQYLHISSGLTLLPNVLDIFCAGVRGGSDQAFTAAVEFGGGDQFLHWLAPVLTGFPDLGDHWFMVQPGQLATNAEQLPRDQVRLSDTPSYSGSMAEGNQTVVELDLTDVGEEAHVLTVEVTGYGAITWDALAADPSAPVTGVGEATFTGSGTRKYCVGGDQAGTATIPAAPSDIAYLAVTATAEPASIRVDLTEGQEGCDDDEEPCPTVVVPQFTLPGFALVDSDTRECPTDSMERVRYRYESERGEYPPNIYIDGEVIMLQTQEEYEQYEPPFIGPNPQCQSDDSTCSPHSESFDNGYLEGELSLTCNRPLDTDDREHGRWSATFYGQSDYRIPPDSETPGWALTVTIQGAVRHDPDRDYNCSQSSEEAAEEWAAALEAAREVLTGATISR